MEGLVAAAQKYSPKEGVNFQQYAQLRIRGSIIDYLRKNSNLCRTTIKKKQEFDRCKFELQKELGRELMTSFLYFMLVLIMILKCLFKINN